MSARWCRGSRLLVAGAALWAAFVAAHLLLSGRWWAWSVFDVLPPLAFAVAPVLLVAVLGATMARGYPVPRAARALVVGLAALALVAGVGSSGLNLPAWSSAPPPPGAAVRVFAWNTEHWAQHDDPDAFYAYLRSQRADVYLLQEYVHHADGEHLRIDETPRLRREFPGYQVVTRGELITLSRFPVLSTPAVPPDRAGAIDWATEFRDAKTLRTDLRVGDRVVSVYNTHIAVQFDFSAGPKGFYRHLATSAHERTEQLDGLVADVAANPNPVVVAGDFNTTPAMGSLAPLHALLDDAVRASPALYPTSWHQAGGLLGWRLDWAFTSPGVPVHDYRFTDPRGLSDHRPQVLLISPPAPRTPRPAPR